MTYDTDEYDADPEISEGDPTPIHVPHQTHRAADLPEPPAAEAPKRPYTMPPLTKAAARVNKAKAKLDQAQKAHARVAKLTEELPDLDAVQAEHDEAVAELNSLL